MRFRTRKKPHFCQKLIDQWSSYRDPYGPWLNDPSVLLASKHKRREKENNTWNILLRRFYDNVDSDHSDNLLSVLFYLFIYLFIF